MRVCVRVYKLTKRRPDISNSPLFFEGYYTETRKEAQSFVKIILRAHRVVLPATGLKALMKCHSAQECNNKLFGVIYYNVNIILI